MAFFRLGAAPDRVMGHRMRFQGRPEGPNTQLPTGNCAPPCTSPARSRAKPLSALLGDVFSDAYAKQGFAARELVTRWADIAGPDIAKYCEPLKMQWPRPVEGQPQEPATLVLRVDGTDGAGDPAQLGCDPAARQSLFWLERGRPAGAAPGPFGTAQSLRAPCLRQTRKQWQKSPKACRRSKMKTCARRWRGWAPRSREIEFRQFAARHCHDG